MSCIFSSDVLQNVLYFWGNVLGSLVLENPGIWSLQVLESPGKQFLLSVRTLVKALKADKRPNKWKDNVQNRGMRVSTNKTKVMISGEWQKVTQNAVRWPCGVCDTGNSNNSIQCTCCQKWVQRKYSGIKGSIYKVLKTFVCRGCMNPVTSTGCTSLRPSLKSVLF